MGKVTIAFCDANQVYVRRFAAFFGRTRGKLAEIMIFSDREAFLENQEKDDCAVWVLGEGFADCARLASGASQVMLLVEQERADTELTQICKYQQAREVIDRILTAGKVFGQGAGHSLLADQKRDTELLAVISPTKHRLLTPFGIALAEYLAQKKRVLYVNLSDCSGLSRWMGMDGEHDVTDLLYLCTKDQPFSGLQIQQAVFRQGEVDYMIPAKNPMLLYEAIESDYERFLLGLLSDAAYDALVLELGIMHQGFFCLVEQCRAVFCLKESGGFGRFQMEEFLEKCRLAGWQDSSEAGGVPEQLKEVEFAVPEQLCEEELWMSCKAGILQGAARRAYEKVKCGWAR